MVAAADIDPARAQTVASEIGGRAVALHGDVSRAEDVTRMIAEARAALGPADILVNNAGISRKTMILDMSEADWRRVIDVNLTGCFLMSKAAAPAMIERGWGRIVNVASTAAFRLSHAGGAAYTASKAALVAFTRHLAYETARYGVTVNALCPGTTMTEVIEKETPTERAERLKNFPTGRFPLPDDQAALVVFLCSEHAACITGQPHIIDSGSLLGWSDFDTYLGIMGKRSMP